MFFFRSDPKSTIADFLYLRSTIEGSLASSSPGPDTYNQDSRSEIVVNLRFFVSNKVRMGSVDAQKTILLFKGLRVQ